MTPDATPTDASLDRRVAVESIGPGSVGSSMRRGITRVLRLGLAAAVVLLLVGGILLYARGGPGATPRGFGSGLAPALAQGSPSGFLYLGALVLLATPLVRVALSSILFARGRDWAFTVITVVVLAILLLTVVVGSRL
ncbi:MAG TPA: DUF1634 domain-containing protein [Thermoplasmata archaeon]|nr:DUF1634 domain-containing protein [Thermoplasmata archaeon]